MTLSFTIETDSIRLRAFAPQDLDALRALTMQTEITDLLPDWAMTEAQLADFLSFVIGSYGRFDPADVRILLAIEHKADERLIGWCGVFPNDLLDPADREVAYAVSKDYRGRGYATSAVQAIRAFIFRHTELERVAAIVKPMNGASRGVLLKAGFRPVDRRRLSDGQDYDYFETRSVWGE
ncbi:Protein N-acetyltransferase, RimJ/RimL family [Cohnella sp. OV330]|uniref:GNAT family N-acetyltransferase n=1 Tax=Cohnella sp. OV330 TaxID=1855288 RepID=UPI0008EF25EF|nr:GNAT family N-acetyltransferase [Cohnella sp. OV330]SFB56435.1 Protein N-acetyltransferase, RimJ/RimL family [Cohnella sp. OV330]